MSRSAMGTATLSSTKKSLQLVNSLLVVRITFEFGQFQGFHQAQCGGEADFITGIDGFQANPDSQVSFADTRWADKNHILPVVDKTEVQQAVDFPFADGGLETVVKFFQAFVQWKGGTFSVLFNALAVTLVVLIHHEASANCR